MRLSNPAVVRVSVVAVALISAGLVTGCGAEDDKSGTPAAKSNNSKVAKGASSGSIQIGDRTISFTPDMCTTQGEESLVSGPGKDADGTPVYVDLDSMSATTGELRVDIGSDKKFSSSDDILRAAADTGDFSVKPNADGIVVSGEFTDGNGTKVGAGTMVVICK